MTEQFVEQFIPPVNAVIDGGPHQMFLFLAGPIQGAADWQEEAYQHLSRLWKPLDGILTVSNPRRKDNNQFQYTQQVDWESLHLKLAAEQGVILFWLAKEQDHYCDRAYAQTTRFELGEWLGKKPGSVIIGIEDGYTGAKYVKHRVLHDWPEVKIYSSLADTCEAAVQKARLIF